MNDAERERLKCLEERVAYLEGLVRELLARPQPPAQVVPFPYPVYPLLPAPPITPWRWQPCAAPTVPYIAQEAFN